MNQDIKVKLTFDYPKETPTLWSPRARLQVPVLLVSWSTGRLKDGWLDNCRALAERIFGTPCHRQEFLFYIDCRASSALT